MLRTMQRLLRLVLDGVYRRTEGEPVFQQACAPSRDELAGLLDKIIARVLGRLTRLGFLVEEEGMTYLAAEVRQLAPFSAIFGFENAFKSMGKPGRVKTIVLAN